MIRGIGLGCLVSCNLQKDVCRRVVNPTERVVKQIFFLGGCITCGNFTSKHVFIDFNHIHMGIVIRLTSSGWLLYVVVKLSTIVGGSLTHLA